MSAGLEVYNQNRVLQITEKFRNLQFVSKGNCQIPSSGGKNLVTITINYPTVKFVGYICTNGNVMCSGINYSLTTGNYEVTFIGTWASTITYYLFGYPIVTPGNLFEVYDQFGNLVFSDGIRAMKVIDSLNGVLDPAVIINNSPNPYFIKSFSIDPNKTIAVLVGQPFRFYFGSMPYCYIIGQYFTFSPTQILSYIDKIGVTAAPVLGTNIYPICSTYSQLLIDVTNL